MRSCWRCSLEDEMEFRLYLVWVLEFDGFSLLDTHERVYI
jgi:hypothetical protein